MMKIKYANFIISSTTFTKCPEPNIPEYAFIGRSNVGKSSLINSLTGFKKLAKISGSPGKTITINHFMINNEWYLVDLPGYGYAKRSKTERSKWDKMIKSYILGRENLLTVFVLIDSRHEPQKNDLEFIEWLGISEIPLAIVFTKADKLKRNELERSVSTYKKTLLDKWEELPPYFVTSAVKGGEGNNEVLDFIEKTNLVFGKKI
ncbi:MAG: YihA family ribosome biogenesis GTP-binding protein [Chlorobi bacterium]|nr:YihA family ribosome biogenesis GTP-binding protein [Chlorobiota bacterium]